MNLLVSQLKIAIADLLKNKGIAGARVLDKVNARGEIVIGIILPKPGVPPAPRTRS